MARILVVDDERLVLDAVRKALERMGQVVSTALGGQEALAADVPDLLLTDIGMPGMDGVALAS